MFSLGAAIVGIDPAVYPVALAGGGPKADDVRAYGADVGDVRWPEGTGQSGEEIELATLMYKSNQLGVIQIGKEVALALDSGVQEAAMGACFGCHSGQFQGRQGVHLVRVRIGRSNELYLGPYSRTAWQACCSK